MTSLRQRESLANSASKTPIEERLGTSSPSTSSTSTSAQEDTATATQQIPLYEPPPTLEPYHRLAIALLGLTVLIGTLHSLFSSSAAITSFRGRLPSPSDTISFSKSSLPIGPLATLNLGGLNPNYFANKRNIFNVLLVKKAWGWTTLLFLAHWLSGIYAEYISRDQVRDAIERRAKENTLVRRKAVIWRPLARYILATAYWLLFTTWFFGPSLSDRLLIASGAICVPSSLSSSTLATSGDFSGLHQQSVNDQNVAVHHRHCLSRAVEVEELQHDRQVNTIPTNQQSDASDDDLEKGASSAAEFSPDKATKEAYQKAYWKGGHDISGHSFLLTLSALFLLTEISPTLSLLAGPSTSVAPPVPRGSRALLESATIRKWAAIVTFALCCIWWWMLLMTSLYFHTPQEKISGFIVGLGAWWGSYKLAG